MNGFEAYKIYLAVTNHFKSKNYDYFTYRGKMKVSESTYLARKDRYSFEKASKRFKREEFEKFLVSNIIKDTEDIWIGNMMNGKGEVNYRKYLKNLESLSYNYKEDLSVIYDMEENFDKVFTLQEGHPLLYRLFLRNKVHINTCVILNGLVNYDNLWTKKDDMMLNNFINLLDKYTNFLYTYTNIEKSKYKSITLEIYNN